jgi:RNA polymerase sigma-70 factor (ECF subfamily)
MSLRFDEAAEEFFDRRGHWSAENLDGHWSSDPEHGVSQAQFLELLQSCLGKLPSVHQKVFLLREVSELEADEICQLLGLGVSNLRVILHRSRLALQRCISVSAESKERV